MCCTKTLPSSASCAASCTRVSPELTENSSHAACRPSPPTDLVCTTNVLSVMPEVPQSSMQPRWGATPACRLLSSNLNILAPPLLRAGGARTNQQATCGWACIRGLSCALVAMQVYAECACDPRSRFRWLGMHGACLWFASVLAMRLGQECFAVVMVSCMDIFVECTSSDSVCVRVQA